MDISPAVPWILLAVVLAGVVGLLVLRAGRGSRKSRGETGPAAPPRGYPDDDLARFLETPPGSAGEPAAPSAGWAVLAAPAPPRPGEPAVPPAGRGPLVAVGALAVTALLAVVAVVAVLAVSARDGGRDRAGGRHAPDAVPLPSVPAAPTPGSPGAGELAAVAVRPGRDGGAVRLAFTGLVLEQRAVGITVAYPVLEATWNGRQAVAHLRLPTFNCLADTPPADPVAAGCLASLTEYADLASPALTASGDDGTAHLSGRFPTYLRPNGTPPDWTGRGYEFEVRAAPAEREPDDGWVRAEGEIRLGTARASTLDTPDVTVLRGD